MPDGPAPGEAEFTQAWGGGWQLAFPNAGNASTFRGRRYGFHGEASFRPWQVAETSESSVVLEWASGGLRARRRIGVLEDGFRLSTEVTALGEDPEPFIAVEHLTLGSAVTEGGYRLELPAGEVLDLTGGRRRRSPWPGEIDEGSRTRWDTVPTGAQVSRYGAVGPMPTGALRVIPGRMEPELELAWDHESLPFLWIWQEQDGDPAPPWNGCAQALGIEPSMVPDDAGIGAAAANGHLATVQPGETRSWWVTLRLAGARDTVRRA
jgi:galactose mutarotase-like enzyme